MKSCIDCGVKKNLSEFNKNGSDKVRPECKVCEKIRREERKAGDMFLAAVNNLADGILKRTHYALDRPKNKTYKERGIKSLIGTNRIEIRANLINYFGKDIQALLAVGEQPSVDRINPYEHYSLDNIQIIPLRENLMRSSITSRAVRIKAKCDGGETIFESISEASRHLKIKRDTIYAHLDKGTTSKKGYSFVSA